MFWKKKHCKANWTALQCFLTPWRERWPGIVVFPPNTPDPQQWTTRLQGKRTGRLPITAKPDHRREKSVSEEEGVLCGMVAPIKAVAMVSRTVDRISALENIYFFLGAVLVSIQVCWGMYLGVCGAGKSEHETEFLQFDALLTSWTLIPMGLPEFYY